MKGGDSGKACRLLVALVVLASGLGGLLVVPVAGAQVTAGGTYHVGPNVIRYATASGALGSTGTCGNALACMSDGNLSSSWSASVGSVAVSTSCASNGTVTLTLPAAAAVDAIHVKASGGKSGYTSCLQVMASNGGADTRVFWSNYTFNGASEAWANFSTTTATSIKLNVGNSAGFTTTDTTLNLYELEVFGKNETTFPFAQAYANELATTTLGLPGSAASVNFASASYTMPAGSFYVAVASSVNATTGYADPMKVFGVSSGVTASVLARSRVLPDHTGVRTCGVTIWNVSNAQAGQAVVVKPESNDIATGNTVCRFDTLGAAFSSTLATWRIQANLSAWGGTSADDWALVYQANTYPFVPVTEADMNPSDSTLGPAPDLGSPLLSARNFTAGINVAAAGTSGTTFVVTPSLTPFSFAGNGYFIALGQLTASRGTQAGYQVLVNGYPAPAVGSGTNGLYEFSIFYLDDIARRNGADNANGSVYQGNYRPFAQEGYTITLRGGWDPAYPVTTMNTLGADGHVSLACVTLCWSNVEVSGVGLPTSYANHVTFKVVNSTAAPLQGVRVRLVNNSSTVTTSAAGYANFTNVFSDAYFDFALAGYQTVCFSYYFRTTAGSEQWVDGSTGCPAISSTNLTLTLTMHTLDEAGAGSNLTVALDPLLGALQVTFSGNATRVLPDGLNVTVTRNLGVDLYLDLVKFDKRTGTWVHVGGTMPTIWPATSGVAPVSVLYPAVRASEPRDVAPYYLQASTLAAPNATVPINGVSLCIVAAWADAAGCKVTLDTATKLQIAQETARDGAAKVAGLQQETQAAQEKRIIGYVLDGYEFATKDSWGAGVPNWAWFDLVCMCLFAIAIIGRLGRRFG